MATSIGQYAPVFLPGEPPWQRSLADPSLQGRRVGHNQRGPACIDVSLFIYFACGSSAPLRVECEGGMAAWLVGTLEEQKLRPYQSHFSSLL